MVTKTKDLRTGHSVWQRSRASPLSHASLTRELETEVLVIGAGITGAMLADVLVADGIKVVVVDQRGAAKG
jgi:NADPH-dependent 2,4-dienoyl-CoA reductase/sulfur reductase-like enzyme